MKQKDDYLLMIEDYECLNNNSKFECRFCNGFGKYLNKYIVESTAECYKSRIMGEGELKYPENMRGLSPEEFAKEFVGTNYFYQRECFKEMIKEYKREETGDRKLGRKQLYSGLEELSVALKGPVSGAMDKVCKACRKYLRNPFSS